MRISDWSSDVCSSDLHVDGLAIGGQRQPQRLVIVPAVIHELAIADQQGLLVFENERYPADQQTAVFPRRHVIQPHAGGIEAKRSEEHTSELQSLMRISYAVFCLKKKKTTTQDIY